MNIRMVLSAGLLLMVGTAVAGSLLHGEGKPVVQPTTSPDVAVSAGSAVTPEMIAMWQATAESDDYFAAKVPI